jgi:fatty-acyl-CoA synthase
MDELISQAPTGTTMILRALARCAERMAFAWDGGSLTYRAALDLIGRLQAAMAVAGLKKGQTAAFLSANSAETWCAGVAAAGLGLIATWLHPLGALDDHLEVIEDAEATVLIVDPRTHGQRGGELAAKAADRLKVVLTMGQADFGRDVMAAADKVGAASPVDLTHADDYAVINYTGGTTGKSKGAIRRHRSTAAMSVAVAADFELPGCHATWRRRRSPTSRAPRSCRRCSRAARFIS